MSNTDTDTDANQSSDTSAWPPPAQYQRDFARMAASGQPMGMLTPAEYNRIYAQRQGQPQQGQSQSPLQLMPNPAQPGLPFMPPPPMRPFLPAQTMGPDAQGIPPDPTQPASFGQPQQFIRNSPEFEPSRWGQPDIHLQRAFDHPGIDPSPMMPQPREIPGLIHSLGSNFARFGSYGVGMSSAAMMNNWAAYVNGYVRGQLLRAQLAKGQMEDAMNQTIWQQRGELLHAAEILDTYGKDPNRALAELRQFAIQNNDQYLLNATDQGLDQAKAVLSTKNSWLSDLMKTKSQSSKGATDLSAWGISGTGGGAFGSEFAVTPPGGAQAPNAPGAPAPPTSTNLAAPAGGAAKADPNAIAASADVQSQARNNAADAAFNQSQGVQPGAKGVGNIAEMGRVMFQGNELPGEGGAPKDIAAKAGAYYSKLQADASNLLARCQGEDGPNGCVSGMADIDTMTAQTLRGIINNQIDSGTGSGLSSRMAVWKQMLRNFARKATGGKWNENDYKIVQDFKNTNGRTYNAMIASSRMALAGANVIDAARDLGLNSSIPRNVMREWLANHFVTDTRWNRFMQAWSNYSEQTVQVARGTGGNEADIQRNLNIANYTNIRGVLAALQTDTRTAAASLGQRISDWARVTNGKQGPAPGTNNHDITILNIIGRNLDPNTATYPGVSQIPIELTPGHAVEDIPTIPEIQPPGGQPMQTKSVGGKTYYKWPDGHWDDAPPQVQ